MGFLIGMFIGWLFAKVVMGICGNPFIIIEDKWLRYKFKKEREQNEKIYESEE